MAHNPDTLKNILGGTRSGIKHVPGNHPGLNSELANRAERAAGEILDSGTDLTELADAYKGRIALMAPEISAEALIEASKSQDDN